MVSSLLRCQPTPEVGRLLLRTPSLMMSLPPRQLRSPTTSAVLSEPALIYIGSVQRPRGDHKAMATGSSRRDIMPFAGVEPRGLKDSAASCSRMVHLPWASRVAACSVRWSSRIRQNARHGRGYERRKGQRTGGHGHRRPCRTDSKGLSLPSVLRYDASLWPYPGRFRFYLASIKNAVVAVLREKGL